MKTKYHKASSHYRWDHLSSLYPGSWACDLGSCQQSHTQKGSMLGLTFCWHILKLWITLSLNIFFCKVWWDRGTGRWGKEKQEMCVSAIHSLTRIHMECWPCFISSKFQGTHNMWEFSEAQTKCKARVSLPRLNKLGGWGSGPAKWSCFLLEPELIPSDQAALPYILANHLLISEPKVDNVDRMCTYQKKWIKTSWVHVVQHLHCSDKNERYMRVSTTEYKFWM